jgi:hypothetical protein
LVLWHSLLCWFSTTSFTSSAVKLSLTEHTLLSRGHLFFSMTKIRRSCTTNFTKHKYTILECQTVQISRYSRNVRQMPETPIWLLSRGRYDDAEKALCWLRGWVTPDVVREEFNQLVIYSNKVNKTNFQVENSGPATVSTEIYFNHTHHLS